MLKSYRNFMVAFIPHLLMVIFIVICLPILFNTLNATEVQSNQISIVDNRSVAVSRVISATYVGGSGSDWDHQDIMVGHNGDIYITGKTTSSDFPVTTGTYAGDEDAFIVRMSPDLSTIVACTFLGGSNYDMGQKIQIDASGNVYVAGTTESSDFPTTFGAYQETYQGNNGYWGGDAFIA
ncbi:MAG: hypothetical protein GY865_15520, partial [candidate division Zixibacteria bacterium]|nr:hypothetical protein [candidate division Zixibacteria bacterium]